MADCPLCRVEADIAQISGRNMYAVGCEICGVYNIEIAAAKLIEKDEEYDRKKYLLSSLARLGWEKGDNLEITADKLRNIIDNVTLPRTPVHYMNMVLRYILSKTFDMSEYIALSPDIYPLFFLKNINEFNYIIEKLVENEYLEFNRREAPKDANKKEYRLTLKGWEYILNLSETEQQEKIVFVAMGFTKTLNDLWESAVKPVLEEKGYSIIKINKKLMNREIEKRILESSLMIADFTGNKRRIYYQTALAEGASIPVIRLCKNDDFDKLTLNKDDYNFIIWDTEDELKEKLTVAIAALTAATSDR